MARSLSDDIHLMGDLLGETIRRFSGEAVFASEEEMRELAKRVHDAQDGVDAESLRERLSQVAGELGAEQALEVVRAFSLYFQLVNVAEDEARVRELRRRELERGAAYVDESLAETTRWLREQGRDREEALAALRDLRLRFVFTAHPTEARRRTTERLLLAVRARLETLDRGDLLPREQLATREGLREAVEALWLHTTERVEPPTVLDEVKAGLWYFEHVLLDVVPQVQRQLWQAFAGEFGATDPLTLPSAVSFGSWMGGDRDGNPFVHDGVMERALELARAVALRRYVADLEGLLDVLAAQRQRIVVDAAFEAALERAAQAVAEEVPLAERRNAEEPLRRMLTYMHARLRRAQRFAPGAYGTPAELLEDLEALRAVLLRSGADALANGAVLDVIARVRAFGFAVAPLDLREDARIHRQVMAELLGDPDYAGRSDEERLAKLEGLTALPPRAQCSAQARRVIDCFATLAKLQPLYGEDALSTYIISRCESAADVYEIFTLARAFGVERKLDIVPLYESRAALDAGAGILERLCAHPAYRAHLSLRNDVQEVLIGYSDSMKEGGILWSRVAIRRVQCELARVARAHHVRLRLFHGRGGSISRGGGPTFRAIAALPREAFSGEMKVTEQGETRAFHFGNPHLAERYLEQTLGASWRVRAEARALTPGAGESFDELWQTLAEESWRAYRELVDDPGLYVYFEQATPYRSIAALHLGSRPSKRSVEGGLDSLRAIPWVFSWSQCRTVLSAWYGVGTAFARVLDTPQGEERLRTLWQRDRFFRDLVDNVEMALAKSDLHIAARYASLCDDVTVRDRVFGRIRSEHERSVASLLRIVGQQKLLDDEPVLQRSIRLRNPYVDPLSYLQVAAMRRVRGDESEELRASFARVSRVATQGIAAGLRHTG